MKIVKTKFYFIHYSTDKFANFNTTDKWIREQRLPESYLDIHHKIYFLYLMNCLTLKLESVRMGRYNRKEDKKWTNVQ